ncbi:hypothetical protein ACO0LF_27455 [Undibacterium sp. Di27W]|uniref:hypothetical protein n=1 Tax=Undibacterium sp. Di27W TaxID=3413036 RepID=UPI003BF2F806
MNIHQPILFSCVFIILGMQAASVQATQEPQEPVNVASAATEQGWTRADMNAPPVADESRNAPLGDRGASIPNKDGQGLYARVTKEYYSQSGAQNSKPEKPETLSKFGFRYSPSGNERLWLEYRFSEKGALRLRSAGHRGVKILAAWEY